MQTFLLNFLFELDVLTVLCGILSHNTEKENQTKFCC